MNQQPGLGRRKFLKNTTLGILGVGIGAGTLRIFGTGQNVKQCATCTLPWALCYIHFAPGSVQSNANSRVKKNTSTLLTKTF